MTRGPGTGTAPPSAIGCHVTPSRSIGASAPMPKQATRPPAAAHAAASAVERLMCPMPADAKASAASTGGAGSLLDGGPKPCQHPQLVDAEPLLVRVAGVAEAGRQLLAVRVVAGPELERRVDREVAVVGACVTRLVLGQEDLVDLLAGPDADDAPRQVGRDRVG